MTVSERLTEYLKTDGGWHSSGSLQRLDWKNDDGTPSTPRSIVRRLQELVEDGTLVVEHREKNHAYYKHAQAPKKIIEYVLEFRDGAPIRVPKISYV